AAMNARWGAAVRVLVLVRTWALAVGQVRYSVPEEAKVGTVVGRLPQELGLEVGDAEARRLRVVWQGRRAGVEVSGASGALVVSSRLDREELCGKSAPCSLRLELLQERPLRVFHVELEVTDINDNAPLFPAARKNISIAEVTTLPSSRFPLEGASDADIGANAQLSYTLSPSEHFALDLQKAEEDGESLFLVLTKPLDRETVPVHQLLLTASDGGRPSLTGTMELVITVLDVNDNAPHFNQSVYKVQLPENTERDTLVLKLNATDLDEGTNSNIEYSLQKLFPQDGREVFEIDRKSGEIRLRGDLDFEDVGLYRFQVDATDQGNAPHSGHCKVLIEVLDVNDNAPEVWVTSLSVPVPEDASVGTVVALLSVSDRYSGANGRVQCSVWPASPFSLESRFLGSYSLVLREALDRERVSEYEVEVRAEDGGKPSLRASRVVSVPVSDVNDNAPSFSQAVYTVLSRENNAAGAELARVWARDPDEAGNGRVSYSLWEGVIDENKGEIRLQGKLDYEEVNNYEITIEARDKGTPPLSGHCKVLLEVLDVNDNAPEVWVTSLSVPVPEDASVGTVVALLSVSDRDSGANGRVQCSVWPASPFSLESRFLGSYSLVLREALDRERVSEYEVEVRAEDGGKPSLRASRVVSVPVSDVNDNAPSFSQAPPRSVTATLSVSLVEGGEKALAVGGSSLSVPGLVLPAEGGAAAGSSSASTNVWLVVAICAVSSVFVLALVLYGASRWSPRSAVLSGPAPATLVCASEVGSWSYSQRQSRSLCVADGAGKSDLMVFSPNFPPPPPGPAAENSFVGIRPSPSPLNS
ncbi:PCDA6 protein, partial [Semnornis frantzii]|nr:PCDA6 protein [Semnornis frantzii]